MQLLVCDEGKGEAIEITAWSDGLVTIPNILREFVDPNPLYGVSHGMGQRDQLPENQLNVAVSGSGSSHMPEQVRSGIRSVLQKVTAWLIKGNQVDKKNEAG